MAWSQSDQADIKALISHQQGAMNRGDFPAIKADYIQNILIIDEFPPFYWQGPNALETWYSDTSKDEAAAAITGSVLKLGAFRRLDIDGDRAYAVVPATWVSKRGGKPQHERAMWTVALQKTGQGWRIAGWTWAGNEEPKAD